MKEATQALNVQLLHKCKFCHHLVTLMSFQACVTFVSMTNANGDILKNFQAAFYHTIKVKHKTEMKGIINVC